MKKKVKKLLTDIAVVSLFVLILFAIFTTCGCRKDNRVVIKRKQPTNTISNLIIAGEMRKILANPEEYEIRKRRLQGLFWYGDRPKW